MRPARLPSSVRAVVTAVESKATPDGSAWQITTTRAALLPGESARPGPRADDIPADVRKALRDFLDSAT